MTSTSLLPKRVEYAVLGAILLLFAVLSTVGITWGLPSRNIDKYLFGGETPWSGEKIYRLAGAADRFAPDRGADVDVDPLKKDNKYPILLTGTDEDIAKIYLRYRLYTYQPDEMITMMALAGMKPRELQFDPRLYQYGGLFIYPVGGLIGACGALGLIDVRGDVVYYLDNPDEFGKFYVVARSYAAAWGLIGVLVVFAIARRLGGSRAGLIAALLFTLMPVVVCMAHEGKPHLPGAVLMLLAVWFAMRYLSPMNHFSRAANFSPRGHTSHDTSSEVSPSRTSTDTETSHSPDDERQTEAHGQTSFPMPPGRDHSGAKLQSNTGCHASRKAEACLGNEIEPAGCHASREAEACPSEERKRTLPHRRDWWLMCICCGAALGMVLSSAPIFILIPLVAWMRLRVDHQNKRAADFSPRGVPSAGDAPSQHTSPRGLKPAARFGNSVPWNRFAKQLLAGVSAAFAVYFVTNPYIVINALVNREVLQSNFGNSFAMYDIARIGEGFIRVLELTVEGATLPVLVLGVIALLVAVVRRNSAMLPLAIPATVFFLQFVLIGAGKPAEYGRFGVFTNTALVIGTAGLLTRRWTKIRAIVNWTPALFTIVWVVALGGLYLRNFHIDSSGKGDRLGSAEFVHWFRQECPKWMQDRFAVLAEPAPYSFPAFPFLHDKIRLFQSLQQFTDYRDAILVLQRPHDRIDAHVYPHQSGWRAIAKLGTMIKRFLQRETPISWANKPLSFDFSMGPPDKEGQNPMKWPCEYFD